MDEETYAYLLLDHCTVARPGVHLGSPMLPNAAAKRPGDTQSSGWIYEFYRSGGGDNQRYSGGVDSSEAWAESGIADEMVHGICSYLCCQ